ncbi:uncharacterized protein PG986_008517 [Apiospora aurea]|uniref:Uncharacterized protein n=1 Tax=Apiospora aurea TaxID=335848 RepID=A0ABR1QFM7_9PEZI
MDAGNDTRDPSGHETTPPSTPSASSFPSSSRTSETSSARSDITLTETGLNLDPDGGEPPHPPPSPFRPPTLSRFLADFTLGFADGLTVPFALTAGLSSLGEPQTVRYAGLAEICAGSISMGIGGYLAAKGEQAAAGTSGPDESAADEMGGDEKEAALGGVDVMEEYLAPLNLRGGLRAAVEAHLRRQPDLVDALKRAKARDDDDDDAGSGKCGSLSPVTVGLSVAIGYLLGGLLPLFPYFFVRQVGEGLRWSFGVCILALFLFGFTKHYLLQDDGAAQRASSTTHDRHHHHRHHYQQKTRAAAAARWRRVRASLWAGTQMVVLGGIAAGAAVLAAAAARPRDQEAAQASGTALHHHSASRTETRPQAVHRASPPAVAEAAPPPILPGKPPGLAAGGGIPGGGMPGGGIPPIIGVPPPGGGGPPPPPPPWAMPSSIMSLPPPPSSECKYDDADDGLDPLPPPPPDLGRRRAKTPTAAATATRPRAATAAPAADQDHEQDGDEGDNAADDAAEGVLAQAVVGGGGGGGGGEAPAEPSVGSGLEPRVTIVVWMLGGSVTVWVTKTGLASPSAAARAATSAALTLGRVGGVEIVENEGLVE